MPREQLKFPTIPPESRCGSYVLTDDPGLTLDQLRSVSSRNGAGRPGYFRCAGSVSQGGKRHAEPEGPNGRLADVGLDLSNSLGLNRKFEGNDSTGYKVILWASDEYRLPRYIVKEDGHYKLLGTSR